MKKLMALGASACLALALAGCGGGATTAASSSAGSEASSAASASSASSAASSAVSSEEGTGIANPWTEVTSADEAAKGAGVDSFTTPIGTETSIGPLDENYAVYSYMDGLAQAECPLAAIEVTFRKGLASAAEDGDISGDYNSYKNTWTQVIDGVEVTCFGNREGEATKTIWTEGDYAYAILAYGAGGDTDYGFPIDLLTEMVAGTK